MKLENQVTNLELSKKLKELGVKQESLYYWVEKWDLEKDENNLWKSYFTGKVYLNHYYNNDNPRLIASAFTVAELGEMLPEEIEDPKTKYIFGLHLNKVESKNWEVWYEYRWNDEERLIGEQVFYSDTEANARAKMLIYLIENKLVKETNT